MDKTKSERLKEILNKKLSSEDIEKKLKEEAKVLSEKKKLEESLNEKIQTNEENKKEIHENEEKIEKTNIEEIEKKEKLIIPSVRDKENENSESNLLLYIVATIAILLLILTIYLFKDDNFLQTNKKQNLSVTSTKNIEEDKPEIKELVNDEITKVLEEKKQLTLNTQSQESEVPIKEEDKEVQDKTIKLVEKDIEKNKQDAIKNIVKNEEKKEEINKKENFIIKEKIITKVVNLNKENFRQYYNSSKYETLKCYNFKAGNIFPDSKCKKDLKKFINTNKDAIRFEIVAVIAKDDNIIFNKIKSKLQGLEQSFQDRVKEYMFRGLGRERVLETSWQIKDILGEDTVLTPTNYYVKSKKNNKGIIIKAYH